MDKMEDSLLKYLKEGASTLIDRLFVKIIHLFLHIEIAMKGFLRATQKAVTSSLGKCNLVRSEKMEERLKCTICTQIAQKFYATRKNMNFVTRNNKTSYTEIGGFDTLGVTRHMM